MQQKQKQQPSTILGRLISRNDQSISTITTAEYTIGRAYGSNYLLSSMECSKTHCRLFILNEPSISLSQKLTASSNTSLPHLVWMIEDLSINGTRINGKKLVKNEPVPLFHSDLIDIKPHYCLEFLSDFAKYGNANVDLCDPNFDSISKSYLLTRKLGAGTYATVYLAQDLRTGMRYACKALDKSKARIPVRIDDGSSIPEIEIIRHFNHPNIVRIHNYISTKKYLYIFMDLAQSGELFDYLASEGGIQEDKCKVIMYQVFKGLAYLHNHNVVHRDVKPENILLHFVNDEYPRVLLADFGLAKLQPSAESYACKTLCGTLHYLAPEILTDSRRATGYGPQVDMWACGVMLFYLLSCLLPFDAQDDVSIKQKIKTGHFTFMSTNEDGENLFNHFSKDVKDLIQQLLEKDPANRLTASQALRHPWFQSDKSDLRAIYTTLFRQWESSEKPGGWFAVSEPITESQALLSQTCTNHLVAATTTTTTATTTRSDILSPTSPFPGTFVPSLSDVAEKPSDCVLNGKVIPPAATRTSQASVFYSQQPEHHSPSHLLLDQFSLPLPAASYQSFASYQAPASP